MVIETDKNENAVKTSGKITSLNSSAINLGTARILLTKDTKYINVKQEDLKVGSEVSIEAEVRDNKTYALKVTLISSVKKEETKAPEPTQTETTETQTSADSQ